MGSVKGLGDVVEKFTTFTGLKNGIKQVFADCGCDERQKKLNEMFPFTKNVKMGPEEKKVWERLSNKKSNAVTFNERESIRLLFNKVFNQNKKPSTCGSCIKDQISKLQLAYENSCDSIN